jgi:hypothetical protein
MRKNVARGVATGQGPRGFGEIHAFGDLNLYLRRTKGHLVLSSEHRAAPASPPGSAKGDAGLEVGNHFNREAGSAVASPAMDGQPGDRSARWRIARPTIRPPQGRRFRGHTR